MFEIFGLLTKPTPSALPLLLALWPLAGAFACLGDPRRARARAVGVCVSGALVAAAMFVLATRWPGEERFLLRPLGVAARVGQLDLLLALGLDPLAAFASLGAFAVTALFVAHQGREAIGVRRRIALLCAMGTTAQLAAMADGAAMLLLAAGACSLLGGALGYVRAASFVADRIADVALASAAAITFWTLGGSWIAGQYVPELDARVVSASAQHATKDVKEDDDDDKPARMTATRPSPARAGAGRAARATLSFTSLPGATVLVDGAWLRTPSQSVARSPFIDVPIATGPHTIRVHVGAGSDDYYIPRLNSVEGEHVTLALQGATTTFREIEDDLVMHSRSDDMLSALARRRFFGVSAAGLVLGLLFAAFMARARLFPFGASPKGEPARALAAIVSLVIVARYPFGEASPRTATVIACVLLWASVMAFAGALRGRGTQALLAGELGVAGAGMVAGAPAIAMLHGVLAALVLTYRRAAWPRGISILFFATRVAIIGALSSLVYGAVPVALGLVAILLGSLATGRADHSSRAFGRAALAVATAVALVLAIDPRVVGVTREPLVASLLRPSLGALSPFAPCSVPLFVLVAALHAFAWIFSRSRTYADIGSWRPLGVLDAMGPALPVMHAIISAAAAALFEVETRLSMALDASDRGVRAACALLRVVDDTATSLAPHRIPTLSERTTRLVLVPIALATAVLFALPWLS